MRRFRLVIKQGNIEKSLLVAEESANGDLQINFSLDKGLIAGPDLRERITRRSMSIHTSAESFPPVRTITNKMFRGQTLSKKDYSLFRIPSDGRYVWPVSCDLIGGNLPRLESKKIKVEDTVVRLASYNQVGDSLFMSILLTERSFTVPETFGFSRYAIEFSDLQLTFLYNFAILPTPKLGLFHIYTTAPSKSKLYIPILGQSSQAVETFSLENIEYFLRDRFYQLATLRQIVEPASTFVITKPQLPRFTRFPAS